MPKDVRKAKYLHDFDVVIIHGVSAVQAAASVLGVPLMHDFAVISLSDLLTPWDLIEKRLEAAAADFVIALYNLRGKGRTRHLERALEIMLQFRAPDTPVGIVRNACREGKEKILSTLVADIDRGGVFAQIVGSLELLEPGIEFVEDRTRVPVLGVVPYFTHFRIPEEDSVALEKREKKERGARSEEGKIRVGVVRFPRISNYTDFDALESELDVDLRYVREPGEIDGLDILILPGSKSTIGDLAFLVKQGLFQAVREFPGPVAGIRGGYQMLGRRVRGPHGVESAVTEAEGLGLLDVETVLLTEKETHQAEVRLLPAASLVAPGCTGTVSGYEIHMGETVPGPGAKPFAQLVRRSGMDVAIPDGAVSADGRVFGVYLHGIFDNHGFRTAFLNRIRREKGLPMRTTDCKNEDPFDLLAEHLERHLDMERLLRICGITG